MKNKRLQHLNGAVLAGYDAPPCSEHPGSHEKTEAHPGRKMECRPSPSCRNQWEHRQGYPKQAHQGRKMNPRAAQWHEMKDPLHRLNVCPGLEASVKVQPRENLLVSGMVPHAHGSVGQSRLISESTLTTRLTGEQTPEKPQSGAD